MVRQVRLCSVSVDLDEIACYAAIHGLKFGSECHAVYDLAVARSCDFAANLALPLTFFVVARDLERPQNVATLNGALARGHEIGNHSLDHLYDLTRRTGAEQARQVLEANRRIETLLGVTPRGFRAPGYTVTDELLCVLRDAGLHYDSSVFPCPAYYAAKAATMLGMALRGRKSRSILDSPLVLRAPTTPYRAGTPYWQPGSGIFELPIQVAGPLRLPFIGTSLALLGPRGARLLARNLIGLPFINLELHGIDFLEARDVPDSLLALQPDLRVPLARKLETFQAVLEALRLRGYASLRLDHAAQILAGGSNL